MILCLLLLCLTWQDTEVYEPRVFLDPDVALPSFNSRDISVRELLRQVSLEKKVNIVVDESVETKVTLQMHETTVNHLLNMLVTVYGLEVQVVQGIIIVNAPKPAPPPLPVNDITYDGAAGTVVFDLAGMDIDAFAREFTRITGRNLLPAARGIRASLKGLQAELPLEQGLRLMLQSNGLAFREEDGVWFYGTPEPAKDAATPAANEPVEVPVTEIEGRLKPGSMRFSEDGLVSARYENMSIDAIIREFAKMGVVPTAIHGLPAGTISMDVVDLTIDQFFKILLVGSDFGFVEKDGVYVLGEEAKTKTQDRRIVSLKYLNAEMVSQALPESLREGAGVTILKELNSLLIAGEGSRVQDLEALVRSLDQPVAQVLIEVVVVDYNFTDSRDLGVNLSNGDNQLIPGVDLTLEGFRNAEGDFRVRRLPSNFALRIRALEQKGTARIISKPHVAALNGHEASIKIGTKQFYRLESEELVGNDNPRVRTSQEIKEVEANISLKITPWVTGNGEVTTLIEPTFTNFQGTINDNIPPPISTRELSSTVRLKDGETIILGGLIENIDNLDISGIPFVSRIPLLGQLFRDHKREKRQAELVIYITPHIYYGHEGSVDFIKEREGLNYPLDVRSQKSGEKARSPLKEPWYKRWRKKRQNKEQ